MTPREALNDIKHYSTTHSAILSESISVIEEVIEDYEKVLILLDYYRTTNEQLILGNHQLEKALDLI